MPENGSRFNSKKGTHGILNFDICIMNMANIQGLMIRLINKAYVGFH